MNPIKTQNDWYKQLIDDLKRMSFSIVRKKHAIGKRILKEELKFGKSEYGSRRIENLAEDLDVSYSDLYKCIQFARKYPKIVTALQNLSWHYIVNNLLPESPKAIPADDKIPNVGKAITSPGDLWVLGRHRLLCGDATKIKDVAWLFYGQKADICITSPPYNIGKTQSGKKRYLNDDDSRSDDDYLMLLVRSTGLALLTCQYVFVNLQRLAGNKIPIADYLSAYKHEWAETITWDKITPAPAMVPNVCNSQVEDVYCFSEKGNRRIGTIPFIKPLSNLISINSRQDKEFSNIHKATFPVAFASYFVANFAEQNHIVYDSFGGTGSTLIACEKSKPKRRCYAMEIDPHYCDIIVKRWEDYPEQQEQAVLCERDGSLWLPDGIWQRQYTIPKASI